MQPFQPTIFLKQIVHSAYYSISRLKKKVLMSATISSVGAAVGIETLPVGHSWTELAQSVISLKNSYFTDLSTLTYVHALLLEGGYD